MFCIFFLNFSSSSAITKGLKDNKLYYMGWANDFAINQPQM
jgi:hypothetical protein